MGEVDHLSRPPVTAFTPEGIPVFSPDAEDSPDGTLAE